MGPFITILILIFAIAGVALLIYSKVKEFKGKDCAGCSGCENRKNCGAEQQLNCPEQKDET